MPFLSWLPYNWCKASSAPHCFHFQCIGILILISSAKNIWDVLIRNAREQINFRVGYLISKYMLISNIGVKTVKWETVSKHLITTKISTLSTFKLGLEIFYSNCPYFWLLSNTVWLLYMTSSWKFQKFGFWVYNHDQEKGVLKFKTDITAVQGNFFFYLWHLYISF